MNVLGLLIFASLAVATVFLATFIWAVRSGQYEDTSTPSLRVLTEDLASDGLPDPDVGENHQPPGPSRASEALPPK
jgi:cbb3-type cytochrome oxidase maturation protein